MNSCTTKFDELMSQTRPYARKDSMVSMPPTRESIDKIQEHFGVMLPKSFIEFAKKSKNYDCWFTSIGEDYQSYNHIIRVNSRYKNMRRRKSGHWVNIKPDNFLVIHSDYHDVCLCLNSDKKNESDGEYEMQYWFYLDINHNREK